MVLNYDFGCWLIRRWQPAVMNGPGAVSGGRLAHCDSDSTIHDEH